MFMVGAFPERLPPTLLTGRKPTYSSRECLPSIATVSQDSTQKPAMCPGMRAEGLGSLPQRHPQSLRLEVHTKTTLAVFLGLSLSDIPTESKTPETL